MTIDTPSLSRATPHTPRMAVNGLRAGVGSKGCHYPTPEKDRWVLTFKAEGAGPPVECRVRRLLKAALIWIIQNQFGRRNLTPFVRAELALRLEPLIAAQGQQGRRSDLLLKSAKSSKPLDTRKIVAIAAKLGHDRPR